mmetsp:Transcript_13891/g.52063  ORF Transcript_13891/g.52063 Transcript_13891/m.52063 type:complete len:236 (+) Transcript_13891:410-1117(+)
MHVSNAGTTSGCFCRTICSRSASKTHCVASPSVVGRYRSTSTRSAKKYPNSSKSSSALPSVSRPAKIASSCSLLSTDASGGIPSVRDNCLSFAKPLNSSARETVPLESSSHCSKTRRILLSSFALQFGFARSIGTVSVDIAFGLLGKGVGRAVRREGTTETSEGGCEGARVFGPKFPPLCSTMRSRIFCNCFGVVRGAHGKECAKTEKAKRQVCDSAHLGTLMPFSHWRGVCEGW